MKPFENLTVKKVEGDGMVGGMIIALAEGEQGIIVTVGEQPYGNLQTLCVEVARTNHRLGLGDTLWWQGKYAYWTPADGSQSDVRIPRLSYSYREARS